MLDRQAMPIATSRPNWQFPTAFRYWGDEEIQAMSRVMASGQFTMGEEVEAFEHEFAQYHGMSYAIMVNSGSSANLVAVAALKAAGFIVDNDLAVAPALAWSTTYAPLVQSGLELELLDCDTTWNADPGSLHLNEIFDFAAVMVACSILGNPAYLDELEDYTTNHDCVLIEDNCESLGAEVNGRLCGTRGLLNTFSFFHSHQISAIEGGMILTNNAELAKFCRMLRAHGWTRGIEAPKSFAEEYNFRLFGYNVRPLELHAAIAREQLKKLPEFIRQRRYHMTLFRTLTAGLPITHPTTNGTPSPFGLAFMVESEDVRSNLVAALRGAGIDCRLPTGGSLRLHKYGKRWCSQATPNADKIHRCGLFVGNAPFDISDRIEHMVSVMKRVLV